MIFKKKIFVILFIFITLNSCKKCEDAIFWADLTYSLASILLPEVAPLTPLPFQRIIENLSPACQNNEDAGKSTENDEALNVKYRPDEKSPWQDATINGNEFIVSPVNSLKAGGKETKNDKLKFTTPGIYTFGCKVDYFEKINEKDENNNGVLANNSSFVRASSTNNTLSVKVIDKSGVYKPNYDINIKVNVILEHN